MVRQSQLRRKPAAPDLNMARGPTSPSSPPSSSINTRPLTAVADPQSPPETPDTSPYNTRKSSQKTRYQPPPFQDIQNWLNNETSSKSVAHSHQVSHRPKLGNPSPRSTCSSSDNDDDDSASASSSRHAEVNEDSSPEHSESELLVNPEPESESDSDSSSDDIMDHDAMHSTSNRYATLAEIVIEEIDPMDSDYEGLEALFPDDVESDQNPTRSPTPVDRGMTRRFTRMRFEDDLLNDDAWSSSSDSSSSLSQNSAERNFYKQQTEVRRRRRISMSSSLGKRTHSELSNDSDSEDGTDDVNELGSSARRMRKRLHRTSLLFQDPPVQRIEELEEPDSSEDERFMAGHALARQMPFWDIEIVEITSP